MNGIIEHNSADVSLFANVKNAVKEIVMTRWTSFYVSSSERNSHMTSLHTNHSSLITSPSSNNGGSPQEAISQYDRVQQQLVCYNNLISFTFKPIISLLTLT